MYFYVFVSFESMEGRSKGKIKDFWMKIQKLSCSLLRGIDRLLSREKQLRGISALCERMASGKK